MLSLDLSPDRKWWEELSQDAEMREELSAASQGHLSCYADCSVPFSSWLGVAERRLDDLRPVPRNRNGLQQRAEEVQVRWL